MKTLKLNHDIAEQVSSRQRRSTWRVRDDKDLTIDDRVELIDKVDPHHPQSWVVIGIATIEQISIKRINDIAPEDFLREGYDSKDEMIKTYRAYYGPEVDERTPVKMLTFHFEPYKPPKPYNQTVVAAPIMLPTLQLYADGGSRGNPGPSSSAFAILDMDDNVVKKDGIYLGIGTNNQAEYTALRIGLEEARNMQAEEVHVYMDSLLVINQMKGLFKVKHRDLWPIHQACRQLADSFHKIDFTHVPREYNKIADAEVNDILDANAGHIKEDVV